MSSHILKLPFPRLVAEDASSLLQVPVSKPDDSFRVPSNRCVPPQPVPFATGACAEARTCAPAAWTGPSRATDGELESMLKPIVPDMPS
mmetsp:Transcript_38820/g.115435  ORF Transcript_38820/g.115435 Transcript_38820/m.115435 type:complete len:89 (+) Transcript_38820:143-409(+)